MSTSSLASCTSDGTGSTSTEVFSVSTVKEIFFDKCPRCRVQFDFLKRTNNVSSKVPLILNCKHTVCEDCIRKMCITNVTACPICKEKFTVTRAQFDSLTTVFTPHFSLIGQLLWNKNTPNKGHINFVSTGLTLRSKQNMGVDSVESVIEAEQSGDECEDAELETPKLSLEFNKCSEHAGSYLNIHCEQCDETVCCYCFVENHGGHTPVYLYKLDGSEGTSVEKLKSEMEIVLKQLQISQRKAKRLKTFDLSNVETDIKKCFSNLHAKLHLAEQNVKKKLQDLKVESTDLSVINSTLKSGVFRVTQVLKVLGENNNKQINVRALFDEIQDLKNIPCRLVSDHGSLEPIELAIKNDFLEDIEDCILLRKAPGLEYSLLPIEDFSTYQIEDSQASSSQIADVLIPNDGKVKDKKEVKTLTNNNEDGRIKKEHPSTSHSKKREKAEVLGGKIKVVLTHLNNLNSFYVQKCSVQTSLRNMNTHIGNRPKKRLSPDDIVEGTTYGVHYETKNAVSWRRGTLKDIVKKGSKDYVYSMFFVDYGNTQYVTIDKLKEIDYFILKKPPYAFECKLYNPDNVTFDPNAHLQLPQIIGEKDLYIQFVKRHQESNNEVQEVDLLVPSSNGNLVSIRNILQWNIPTAEDKEDLLLSKNVKLFKNSKKFSLGQEENVTITYVRDPSHICVQLAQNTEVMEKMKKDMKLFYENQRSVSCVPMEDTDVVVKYEHQQHGNWHRAKIISVDAVKRMVEVLFVDWGGSAVVPWSSIRLLTENFTKIECQAITVSLAHVQRENLDDPWPQNATDYINNLVTLDKKFRMMVYNLEPLEVALFQIRPSADICVNALLVKGQLAISTGHTSETLYWPRDQEQKVEDENSDELSYRLIKQSEEILAEDEDDELKNGLRQQVSVVTFENPDLIYIKFAKFNALEEQLHKELHIHYSVQRKNKDSWKANEYCIIYDAARKAYFRGLIKKRIGSEAYMVYLYDHVRELKVPKNLIFVQEPYFRQFPCYVFKCRLAKVKPAGDSGEWTKLAIEMLQKIFDNYKIIHIKKIESNETDKQLGVIMWYSLTKPAKALEPSKSNFISINQAMIQSGVAFSTSPCCTNKRQKSSDVSDKELIRNSPVDGKNENSKDWYQLICEDEELLKSTLTSWPKPLAIQSLEFDAVLTCVDSEGSFSVRDDEMHAFYLDMEEKINAKFSSMQMPQERGVEWRNNEMCTISYEDSWYRGTVIEVIDSQEVSVEMIDFGSEHTVNKSQIFKQIMFPDVPPLINKIRLHDVYSKFGQWSGSDVDELLDIVTDRVKVVIKGDLSMEMPPAEVYLPSGLSVNDLIIQKCPHLYRLESKVALGKLEADDDDEKDIDEQEVEDNSSESNAELDYMYAPIDVKAKKSEMFLVSVLKSGSEYKAVLNLLNSKSSEANCAELDALNEEIQENIAEQPQLKTIEVDEPCVALYGQKNMWCRARIFDVEVSYVSAFFVDYGTVDLVPIDNLKVMKREWFSLPVYNRIAIIDIELVQPAKAESVIMQLNNLRGKSYTVKINGEDPLRVHLFHKKVLCYQNLINCGIIRAH